MSFRNYNYLKSLKMLHLPPNFIRRRPQPLFNLPVRPGIVQKPVITETIPMVVEVEPQIRSERRTEIIDQSTIKRGPGQLPKVFQNQTTPRPNLENKRQARNQQQLAPIVPNQVPRRTCYRTVQRPLDLPEGYAPLISLNSRPQTDRLQPLEIQQNFSFQIPQVGERLPDIQNARRKDYIGNRVAQNRRRVGNKNVIDSYNIDSDDEKDLQNQQVDLEVLAVNHKVGQRKMPIKQSIKLAAEWKLAQNQECPILIPSCTGRRKKEELMEEEQKQKQERSGRKKRIQKKEKKKRGRKPKMQVVERVFGNGEKKIKDIRRKMGE